MAGDALQALARDVLDAARIRHLRISTAESCTGGMIAARLTDVAGSSDVVDRGFVTYSNEAKIEVLGVPVELIERHGAVAPEVAAAMAEGALARSHADLAVSCTGIAGPGGGSPEKPVGLVYVAVSQRHGPTHVETCRFGDVGRHRVRERTVETALNLLQRIM